MIQIGKGLLAQINKVHEYPVVVTKENTREALISISNKWYEELWKRTFGETYTEFVDKILEKEEHKEITI